MHEIQWQGIRKGREEFSIFFLQLIVLDDIFTLALPSSLPSPAKEGLFGHHQ